MLKRTLSSLPSMMRLFHDHTHALRSSASQHVSDEKRDADHDFIFSVGEARYMAVHENKVSRLPIQASTATMEDGGLNRLLEIDHGAESTLRPCHGLYAPPRSGIFGSGSYMGPGPDCEI